MTANWHPIRCPLRWQLADLSMPSFADARMSTADPVLSVMTVRYRVFKVDQLRDKCFSHLNICGNHGHVIWCFRRAALGPIRRLNTLGIL
jgi:hypothetical protein